MSKALPDEINSPSHYAFGEIEVIDAIEDWCLGYHRGNIIKYIVRAGRKDPASELKDLKKGLWYLQREIENLEPKRARK